jgi:DNA-binding NtrC family response regulator
MKTTIAADSKGTATSSLRPRKLLLLDADANSLRDFSAHAAHAFDVITAQSEDQALDLLRRNKVDVMLLDLPSGGGSFVTELIQRFKDSFPDLLVILTTTDPSLHNVAQAMKMGAYDYVSKPSNVEELQLLVERGLAERSLRRNYDFLREQSVRGTSAIVGKSQVIQELHTAIQRVAPTDVNVLITGESGTGKELVARAIHDSSNRRGQAFVVVNCASIVKELIESELFGHQRGSFTGAIRTKIGKFEQADGGTIFLDEISEFDQQSQVKLLRVLQERVIERVGSLTPIHVDVRVIAATNQNLTELTRQGLFREDLFYRLNVFPIVLPPLRTRVDDIPHLAQYFLKRYSVELSKPGVTLSDGALEMMMSYPWAGNVRELENVVQRAILLCTRGTIQPEHLPLDFTQGRASVEAGRPLREIEREARDQAARRAIARALEETGWVVREAAEILQIPEKTLYDRCSKLGIRLSGSHSE